MQDRYIQVSKFSGITDPVSSKEADPGSFANLVNLSKQGNGTLANRRGYRHIFDTDIVPDAFIYNRFLGYIGKYIILSGNKIYSKTVPGTAIDITSNATRTVVAGGIASIIVDSGVHGFIGAVIYNTTKRLWNYVAYHNLPDATIIYFAFESQAVWEAGDSIILMRNGFLSTSDIVLEKIGYPSFKRIDNSSNLILSGVREAETEQNIWVGEIYDLKSGNNAPRKYFGGLFEYSGAYVSPLHEEFNRGAFTRSQRHLSVRIYPYNETLSFEYVSPNRDVSNTGWSLSSGSELYKLIDDYNDPLPDSEYIFTSFPNVSFRVGFANPIYPEYSSNVELSVAIRASSLTQRRKIPLRIDLFDSSGHLGGTIGVFGGATLPAYSEDMASIICGRAPDYETIEVRVTTLIGDYIRIHALALAINNTLYARGPILVEDTYNVSIGLILDGFNYTKLIYPTSYGPITETIGQTSRFRIFGSNKVVELKITTPNPEQINKRATHIYVAVTLEGKNVWRICKVIDLSSAVFRFEDGAWYFYVWLGNEINTSPKFEDVVGAFSGYDSVKSIYAFESSGTRSYAVSTNNRSIVNYTPITGAGYLTALLSQDNFIKVSGQDDDVVGLRFINDKLIVFKRNSVGVLIFSNSGDKPAYRTISDKSGLASQATIATSGDGIVFYLSYSGIYATDGFKALYISEQIENTLKKYTTTQLESAFAFYSELEKTYYLVVYTDDSSYDMWAYRNGAWSKISFADSPSGYPSYVVEMSGGYVVFSNKMQVLGNTQFYEYPRQDGEFTNRVVMDDSGEIERPTLCSIETNGIDFLPLDIAAHIDEFYIKTSADGVISDSDSVLVRVFNGARLVKQFLLKLGRTERVENLKIPFTSFKFKIDFYAKDKLDFSEWGIRFKQINRVGSVKQHLLTS